MRQIVIEIPYTPPGALRKNSHGANRWAAKEARDLIQADTMVCLSALGYSSSTVHIRDGWWAAEVQYISFYCGKPIDSTEFATGMAPVLDCFTPEKINHRSIRKYVMPGIGLLPDDSPEYVRCLPTKYRRVPHKTDIKTLMIVTEITETEWEYVE